MGATGRSKLPDDLARGRCRLQAWRAQRHRGSRIPQRFWTLAVELVQRHGVSRTATTLGLDYYQLKRRAATAAPAPAVGPAFVEVAAPLTLGKQCLLELHNGTGANLRIQLAGYDSAEIAALARRLWNAR
jgi:hypothetical protein